MLQHSRTVMNSRWEKNPEGFEPALEVSTKKIGNDVQIKIKDNGDGIPSRILDQPVRELGLSPSYDIIMKEHGGTLQVVSEEDRGSEFIIALPMEG